MTTKVRPLDADDRARWEQMFQAYAEFYKTSIPGRRLRSSLGLDLRSGE